MCWFLHSRDGWFVKLLQTTLKNKLKRNPKFHLHPVKTLSSLNSSGFWFADTSNSLCLWNLFPCAFSCASWESFHALIPQSWRLSPELKGWTASALLQSFVTCFILHQPAHLKMLRQQVTVGLADFKRVRKLLHKPLRRQKWGAGGNTKHLEMETLPADLVGTRSWSVAMTISYRGLSDVPASYPSPVISFPNANICGPIG